MSVHGEELHEVEVCDHITCLIDLLAQKEHLKDWSVMPLDDILTPTMTEAIQRTAGMVWHYRHLFAHYATEFNKPTIPKDQIATLVQERQDFYYRIRNTGLRTQQFSDTFLVYAPLWTLQKERMILPTFGVLFACCITMLYALGNGIPVRGAVYAGVGIELSDSNFYGPALAEVYRLESTVAQYPRIVVSEKTVQILDEIIAGTSHFVGSDSMLNGMNELAAKDCRKLVALDHDGRWIVDYLGAKATELFDALPIESVHLQNLRKQAFAFSNLQLDHFQQLFASNGDERHERLRGRYAQLCEYFRSRGVE